MKSYRLLIVDDSALMRELLCLSLGKFVDIQIDEADDGLKALKKLSENQYDMLFADINMPVMDGLKLVRHIRNNPKTADLPVVIISTLNVSDDVERIRQLGVTDILLKPVTGTQITDIIKKNLGITS